MKKALIIYLSLVLIALISTFLISQSIKNNAIAYKHDVNSRKEKVINNVVKFSDNNLSRYESALLNISLYYPNQLSIIGTSPGDSISIGRFTDDVYPTLDIYLKEYWGDYRETEDTSRIKTKEFNIDNKIYWLKSILKWSEGGLDENECAWSYQVFSHLIELDTFYIEINTKEINKCNDKGDYIKNKSKQEDIDVIIKIVESIKFL